MLLSLLDYSYNYLQIVDFFAIIHGVLDMETQENKFGFTGFAETWNGRLAMLGFVIAVATELITGQGILSQLGLM